MSFWLFRIAAALSFAGVIGHEFLGAPMVLPPLSLTEMPHEVIWLHHFSWHVGSVAGAAIVILYVYASIRPGQVAMAVVATGMSAGFACLGIGLGLWGSSVMWGTPAPYVWSLVALIGGLGVWASQQGNVA